MEQQTLPVLFLQCHTPTTYSQLHLCLSALSGAFLYNSDVQLLEVTACLQDEVQFTHHCKVFNNTGRTYFPVEINEKPMQHF